MNVCSHSGSGMSVSKDVNSLPECPVDLPHSTSTVIHDVSVDDLGADLTELLNIQGDQDSVSGSILNCGKNGVEKDNIVEKPSQSKLTTVTSEKGLSKSATFPCSNVTSSVASVDGQNEDDMVSEVLPHGHVKANPAYPRSISLPTPLKLVSAMKGTREKLGTPPPKKLTVTWAPDVYDPTPTAVSHVVSNKPQRHRNESRKNAKNKQKGSGKASRKGKDKKQVRKYGGSSNRCFKSLDDDDRAVDCDEPRVGLMDFNVGSPDPYCGSSFLKTSVTKLHFSVAEAT
ncbi:hypothetical protein RJ640_014479 [Escallonia rubra]|uniref:Uncharacterized protein n=1 Tax=Escallonia rubra TaxID=112253 RepID=A0AA88R2Z6_9ASTE|nr:hypothetical protein RJ640_014479 [Escallonia rubra]